MKTIFVFAVILVIIGAAFAIAQDFCGPNESWTECGTACPPSCETPKPQMCTLQCVVGCQCNPGFLKNSRGQCVLRHQC